MRLTLMACGSKRANPKKSIGAKVKSYGDVIMSNIAAMRQYVLTVFAVYTHPSSAYILSPYVTASHP